MVFFVICRLAMWVIKLIGGEEGALWKTTAVMVILMELWAQVGVPSYSVWFEYISPDTDCSVAPPPSCKHDRSPCWGSEFVRMTERVHLCQPNDTLQLCWGQLLETGSYSYCLPAFLKGDLCVSKLPAHSSLALYGLAELATCVNNDHTQSTGLLWLFNAIYQKQSIRIYSGKLEGTTKFSS